MPSWCGRGNAMLNLGTTRTGPEGPQQRTLKRRRRGLRAALILLSSLPLWAQPPRPTEYDVKAAYLFNFGKFMRVTTPPNRSSFNICVAGNDPISPPLQSLVSGEQIGGRAVHVVRSPEAIKTDSCDVVYIGASERGRMESDLAALRGSDVLTVSDAPDFLSRGGMIQFVTQDDHVRFSVNLAAVHRTHIVLSSELLRVALWVGDAESRARR